MSDLRARMARELSLAGLANSSQRVYISSVARLAQHFKKSPAILSLALVASIR
jgi:hypothetical protein